MISFSPELYGKSLLLLFPPNWVLEFCLYFLHSSQDQQVLCLPVVQELYSSSRWYNQSIPLSSSTALTPQDQLLFTDHSDISDATL